MAEMTDRVETGERAGWFVVAGAGFLATVVVGFGSLMYSAMLGFGVNERCTDNANCATGDCPPCDRLSEWALQHAGVQVALAASAFVAGSMVLRRKVGPRTVALGVTIAVLWAILATVAVVTYTDSAWSFANSRG